MKIAIILNGISLQKKFFYKKFLPGLQSKFKPDVFETRTKNEAVMLASKAVDKRYDVILAAGGDGTIHQVLNGILEGRENHVDLPVLGLIPLGSGNDFARSANLHADVSQLEELLLNLTLKKIDVGKITYSPDIKNDSRETCYFINVADLGMGPEVVKKVLDSDRIFGSGISYYRAILSTFFTYKPMTVYAKTPDWEWRGNVRTLAVANGKYYGHGLCIAPDARLNDGMFSAFICGDVSVLDFIWYSGHLKREKKISHPKVSYLETKQIEFASESTCAIEADGEFLGYLPAKVELQSSKIKFLM